MDSYPGYHLDSYNELPGQDTNGLHAWYRACGVWDPASKSMLLEGLGCGNGGAEGGLRHALLWRRHHWQSTWGFVWGFDQGSFMVLAHILCYSGFSEL